jgi:hypothetical protein
MDRRSFLTVGALAALASGPAQAAPAEAQTGPPRPPDGRADHTIRIMQLHMDFGLMTLFDCA